MDSSSWPSLTLAGAAIKAASTFSATDWILLVVLILALLLAATASAAETALTSVNRIKIRNLAEEGDVRARRVARLLDKPQTFLTAILVVSNVSVILASTLATLLAIAISSSYGEIISTVLLSLIVLLFCEITPKTLAVQAPERWARRLVVPVEAISTALRPVLAALTFLTSGIVRLLGGGVVRHGPFVTEDELRLLVEVGEEEGVLEEEERAMIYNVFELADTSAREIMVPRIDMVTIAANATVEAAMDLIVQGGQSRIPVFDTTIDNIVGVLYAKDLLRVMATNQHPATVRTIVRPAYFVPESKRLDDLLREMQQQRIHMAIVVDEYGSVAGLVTIEDLVEEIIGDIQDEYDREEQLIEQVNENEYIVNAKISLDDFNELLGTKLTSEDYDTLGGFVTGQLDKIPTVGDTMTYENLTMTVLSTKGRRVTKVRVVRASQPKPGGEPDASEPRHALPARDSLPQLPAPQGNDGASDQHDADGTDGANREEHDSAADHAGAPAAEMLLLPEATEEVLGPRPHSANTSRSLRARSATTRRSHGHWSTQHRH